MVASRVPSVAEVSSLLSGLRRNRQRLRALAEQTAGGDDGLLTAVDEVIEQLLNAEHKLHEQTDELAEFAQRLDRVTAAYEELFAHAVLPCLQTDEDGRILRVNHAARRLLGLPAGSPGSRTLAGLVDPAQRPAVREVLTRLRTAAAGVAFQGTAELLDVVVRASDERGVPAVLCARRTSDPATGRPLLHWQLQPAGLRTDFALAADERVGVDSPHPTHVQALAEAAADIAEQDTTALAVDHVVQQARRAIPACEEASVTLVRSRGRMETPVATGELAAACDQLQAELRDGPCLGALRENRPVLVADLAGDPRWPRLVPRAAELGVGSVLCLPLAVPRGVLGALNLYAKSPDAFDEDDQLIAHAYARHAAIAISHAELEENLRIGLHTREEIGRAVGILMERHRVTASAAFDMLVVASQHSHHKLRDVAAWVNQTGEDPTALPRPNRAGPAF